MNNFEKYLAQIAEVQADDPEGLNKFIQEEVESALASYPENVEVRLCSICGRPMRYNSMAYHEGFHFDSCL